MDKAPKVGDMVRFKLDYNGYGERYATAQVTAVFPLEIPDPNWNAALSPNPTFIGLAPEHEWMVSLNGVFKCVVDLIPV